MNLFTNQIGLRVLHMDSEIMRCGEFAQMIDTGSALVYFLMAGLGPARLWTDTRLCFITNLNRWCFQEKLCVRPVLWSGLSYEAHTSSALALWHIKST
jgi:hypothetical protein